MFAYDCIPLCFLTEEPGFLQEQRIFKEPGCTMSSVIETGALFENMTQ
jgi:hypothetical protein